MSPESEPYAGGGEYFEVDADGLKIKTVTGGDGVAYFTDRQLRALHPRVAEEAIAFRSTGPFGDYSQVAVDQVGDNIVRLRGRYYDSKKPEAACGSKLLQGQTLGWDRKDWGRRYLHLDGAPMVRPVPARDERGRLLSNEELQESGRQAKEKGERLRWKRVHVGHDGLEFRINDGEDDPRCPSEPRPE